MRGNPNQFIEELKQRLQEPLPGREAQSIMAPRPISEKRFSEDPEKPAKPGGVLLLLYWDGHDFRIPLTKRPEYNGAHSGQISFPGGKVDPRDMSYVDTALRETEEEIGITRDKIQVLGQLSELFIIASNFKVYPTVGFIDGSPRMMPDAREVMAIHTPALSELRNEELRGVKTMHFPPYTIQSPYFDVSGEIVWGATAMILGEFLTVVEGLI